MTSDRQTIWQADSSTVVTLVCPVPALASLHRMVTPQALCLATVTWRVRFPSQPSTAWSPRRHCVLLRSPGVSDSCARQALHGHPAGSMSCHGHLACQVSEPAKHRMVTPQALCLAMVTWRVRFPSQPSTAWSPRRHCVLLRSPGVSDSCARQALHGHPEGSMSCHGHLACQVPEPAKHCMVTPKAQ